MLNGGINQAEATSNDAENNACTVTIESNLKPNNNNILNIRENINISKKMDLYTNESNRSRQRPESSRVRRPESPKKLLPNEKKQSPAKNSNSPNKRNTNNANAQNVLTTEQDHTHDILNTNELEVEPYVMAKMDFTEDELNDFTYILIKNLEALKMTKDQIIQVNKNFNFIYLTFKRK